MESPTKTVLIVLVYLLFVKIIGPAWMKNRKPYHLRLPMILYNFFMIVISAWMFYKFGKHGWFYKYSWKCQPVDYSEDEDAIGVFFVLRKKDAQISVLHVVHHAVVPLTSWFATRTGAAGYNTFFVFVNAFVDIWMYLYYALAAVGSSTRKHLWWKKYLTALQLIQFCIVFVVMTEHFVNPNCEVNSIVIMNSIGQAIIFFVLFARFYVKSYKKKAKIDMPYKNGSAKEERTSQFENGNCSPVRHRSHAETNHNIK